MTTISNTISSIAAQRQFGQVNGLYNASLQKMATGSRINRGADDPSGLIASEQLGAALAALEAESRGIERADAVANVADGALAEISGLLSNANAATVAMANTAGMSESERAAHQMEIDSAMQAADRIASTTRFNGQRVLDGSMTLSVGGASVTIGNASTASMGGVEGTAYRLADVKAGGALDPMTNPEGAQKSIASAISDIATMRGQIGAFQANQLAPMHRANAAAMENTAAARSAIRDTDYAAETAEVSRLGLLGAASLRALVLANAAPERVLRMLS